MPALPVRNTCREVEFTKRAASAAISVISCAAAETRVGSGSIVGWLGRKIASADGIALIPCNDGGVVTCEAGIALVNSRSIS